MVVCLGVYPLYTLTLYTLALPSALSTLYSSGIIYITPRWAATAAIYIDTANQEPQSSPTEGQKHHQKSAIAHHAGQHIDRAHHRYARCAGGGRHALTREAGRAPAISALQARLEGKHARIYSHRAHHKNRSELPGLRPFSAFLYTSS